MDRKYTIIESVGSHIESVHSYQDLEKHHPTWKEDHRRRHYATIDGEREEYAVSPSGERMVSKDFVLKVDGSANVDVPSPVSGYVRRSASMDRWGTVEIYDGIGGDAHLVARIRHMQPIHVSSGERVEVGQPLGVQGRKAPGKVGVHTHMDIAESHLDEFKRFVRDMDAGVIAPTEHVPRPKKPAVNAQSADQSLAVGARGLKVHQLQETLQRLGYTGHDGHPLKVDGDFGANTEFAVRAFQREHHLQVDGRAGHRQTLPAIDAAAKQLLTDPSHPKHALYVQTLDKVHAEEARRNLAHGAHSERLAGAIAVAAMHANLTRIDRVELNTAGTLARAVQVSPVRDEPALNLTTAAVDTHAALRQPLHVSSQQAREVLPLVPSRDMTLPAMKRAVP
jgi:hypothetical protein